LNAFNVHKLIFSVLALHNFILGYFEGRCLLRVTTASNRKSLLALLFEFFYLEFYNMKINIMVANTSIRQVNIIRLLNLSIELNLSVKYS